MKDAHCLPAMEAASESALTPTFVLNSIRPGPFVITPDNHLVFAQRSDVPHHDRPLRRHLHMLSNVDQGTGPSTIARRTHDGKFEQDNAVLDQIHVVVTLGIVQW